MGISKSAKRAIAYERSFVNGVSFGNKTESYYQTEEEMINGYQPPSYDELSKEEKEIWKQREQQESTKFLEV
jgi:hypothetical protein